jgi:predicted DsbA family dithiol-disulfide isomerase
MTDDGVAAIVVWSDVGCPWSHLAVHRLHEARRRLGLEGRVLFDHRAFPLEIVNARPTPKTTLDAEIPVAGARAPEAGWQPWPGHEWHWPVTTLPALEAVQAAKAQGLAASETLDRALRRAFFGQSRCISMRHVVLEVAEECGGVDVEALRDALDDGQARRTVLEHHRRAERDGVKGSPHVFLADGTSVHNPGITMHWEGEHGAGFPVVDADDPSVYDDLLHRASRAAG